MPRSLNRLSATRVANLSAPGVYADGAGLYFRVRGPTTRSWFYVWHPQGKRREIGLGSPPGVGLAQARVKAQKIREMIAAGEDPIAQKLRARAIPTFGMSADEFIAVHSPSVKSEKSIARWRRCIGAGGYADALRPIRVDKITAEAIIDVLKPLWTTKSKSASDLRGYIERVLNAAKVDGYRTGENPAAWAGHLELRLPKPKRLVRGHHAAMPFERVPVFMRALRLKLSPAARALELTVLCATRTSETLNADWSEIDLIKRIWTIPAARMKAGREHRVPLSSAAIKLLEGLPDREGWVFPGRLLNRPLSNMSMEMVLRRIEPSATVHGFRTSFRDWAGDVTDAADEVAEAALAHKVGTGVRHAYRRRDALEKRRQLMEAWAKYCDDE